MYADCLERAHDTPEMFVALIARKIEMVLHCELQ